MVLTEELVSRVPGTVLDVGDDLRIQTYRREKQRGLPLTRAQGRHCYEVLALTDAGTGRPCRENCPLAPGNGGSGWSYSRALRTSDAEGESRRIDCLLVRYLDPSGARTNVCITGLPESHLADTHLRAMQLIDAIYPVTSGATDLGSALKVALELTLGATGAVGAEVLLSDHEGRGLALKESQGLDAQVIESVREAIIGPKFPDAFVHTRLPILGVGTRANADGGEYLYLAIPLVAGGSLIGALGIVGRSDTFDVVSAMRVLFPLTAQLGVYLGWAHRPSEEAGGDRGTSTTKESARLHVKCLGPFSVSLDDRQIPPTRFNRSKALTLLKFLAGRRGRPVPRDVLMELLWQGADAVRSNRNLRVVLHSLRRALEPDLKRGEASSFIVTKGDLVHLSSSSSVWIDVEEFVDRARRAISLSSSGRRVEGVSEYRRAAALYRGEYLEDELYSDWCLFERERLKEVCVSLHMHMASVLIEMGDLDMAVDAYRAALEVDRGREEAHRDLMRLLWKSGRRDEALRQYESCRRSLREELGVGPASETEALYASIVAEPRTVTRDLGTDIPEAPTGLVDG